MAQFEYKMKITADSEEAARKTMAALAKIAKHVKPADLAIIADKIEANPAIVETAKKFM